MAEQTVLVVEDDLVLCELLTQILGAHGYRVEQATDGEEALQVWTARRAAAAPVDVLLLDLMLPLVDGFGVMQYLREHAADVRVVVLSAYPELRRAAQVQGVHAVVGKPFALDELLTAVAQVPGAA